MRLPSVSLVALVVNFAAVFACSSSSEATASCDSTDTSGPCSGTFSCGNGGITLSCDASTQVCVVSTGSVYCETVKGASTSRCPSEADAKGMAGCTTPFHAQCSVGSAHGITVTCKQ